MINFKQEIKYHPQVKLEDYNHDLPFEVVNGVIDGINPFKEVEIATTLPDVDEAFRERNCYNSKITLKNKGVSYPYTDAHKQELKRCKNDIFYFIQNYTYILSLDDGFINFSMYQYQKNMIKVMNDNRFSIFLLPRQMGKALDGETNILTPNGFVKMKDLKIGDFVFDENGKKVKIINKTLAQHDRKCYKIEFAHGDVIIADENHDWVFFDGSMNKTIKTNTKTMLEHFKTCSDIKIQCSKPIEFDSQKIDADPYILGCNNDIRIEYILNTIPIRHSLLIGLLDKHTTDETASVLIYRNKDKNKIDLFRLLLSTFGIVSTCENFDNMYVVSFDMNQQYFYIKSIEEIDTRPVYCIEVDNESHLFLAGDTLIPTHNCSSYDTQITIRNKHTGEVENLSIGELYERCKKTHSS